MKTLLTFALCLFAVVAHAANPSTKSFRAAGGLIVTSNDITGVITYDGSGVVASGTNSSMQVSTNNVASSTMASNINFTAGNNTVLRGTNIGSTAHINYSVASNLTFYSTLGNLVLGTWDGVFGFSNAATASLSLWLAEPDTGNDWALAGMLIATNVSLTAIPGSGTYAGITASGTIYRTNAPSTTDTNIGVGQTLYLDKTFGVDATASRTNLLRPFQTPSNSVAAILSGDTLVVRGGAYPINPKADAVGEAAGWNFQAGVALTNKSNIRIVGEPGAVWYMSSWRSNNLKFSAPMFRFENCTNVVIEGMTFIGLRTNAVVLGHGGFVMNRCSEFTFKDCTFSNFQNHAILAQNDATTYGLNSMFRFWNNVFANIGGTNHTTLLTDGAAIEIEGENMEIVGNRFFNNLRDIEYCCDGDNKLIHIYGNRSVGCYFDHIMLTSTNSSEVVIANNICKGYANFLLPSASADSATWLKIYAGSNVLVQGNIVGGYANGIYSQPTVNTKTIDLRILDNTFHDISLIPLSLPSPGNNMVGVSAIYQRNTIERNNFLNCPSSAITLAGNNSSVSYNTFTDCNLDGHPRGVITVGSPTALVATNSTNISIIANTLVSSAANLGPGIAIYGMNYSNVVHGNIISRNFATNIHDLGVGTRTRPVNLVAAGSLLRSDTNGNERAVVFGSGVAWDGSTGTLTGTGGAGGGVSTNEFQFGAIPTLTLKDGVNITNPVVNGFLEWGMWGTKVGYSNRSAANLALYLNDASDSFWTMPGRLFVGDRASVTTLTVSNMPGHGEFVTINTAGVTMRTNSLDVSNVYANTLFVTNGIPAAGANFEVQWNSSGVLGASDNLRFLNSLFQLQVKNSAVPGEVDINGEGFITQGVGGAQGLAFGIGVETNILINPRGAVIVRPNPGIGTNLFQVDYTNKTPIVWVNSNGVLNAGQLVYKIPTFSVVGANSNQTVWAGRTNTVNITLSTNATFTNFNAMAVDESATYLARITVATVAGPVGVDWGLGTGSAAAHGRYIYTNANNPIWPSLTSGVYVASWTFFHTNAHLRLSREN